MLEWLPGAVTVIDWLRKLFRRRSEAPRPAMVVNPGVTADVNKLAEQFADTKLELGRMETENAWLRSENADLRKARDTAIADLQRRSRTADDPSRFNQALAELEKGHPETAELLFRDIVTENRREASHAAYNIGAIAFHHDTQKALHAFQESVELDPSNVDAWTGVGQLQRRMGNLDEAEYTFDTLLHLGNSNDNDVFRAAALSNLGTVFRVRGDWNMAKDKLMAALKLNEKLGDQEGMVSNYCSIGNVHLSSGDLADAEKMYRKSLALSENVGDKEVMATIYGNLGVVLERRGDPNRAKEMYLESIDLSEGLGHKEGMASVYGNLSGIFYSRGDLDKAAEMSCKALRVNKGLRHKEGMAINYNNLGTISEAQGELAEACRLWKKARDLFVDLGARDRAEAVERAMQKSGCEL